MKPDWLMEDMHSSQEPLLLRRDQSNARNVGQVNRSTDRRASMTSASSRSPPSSAARERMSKSRSMTLPVRPSAPNPFPELSSPPGGGSSGALCRGGEHGDVMSSAGNSPVHSDSPASSSRNSPNPDHAEWTGPAAPHAMLTFHYDTDREAGAYHIVSVDAHVRTADVLHFLVLKSHVAEDKNWAVVERLHDANMERVLEDHELVLPCFKSWGENSDNKFIFRRDFRKYELFQNPTQFFPPHMIDTKDGSPGLSTASDRHTNILLQNLFSTNERMPDIQGHLHVRESGLRRPAWRRYFFVLRPSGLYYSSKGTSKDPRHLVLFSDLSQVNIYSVSGGRKQHGAPTAFCVCLRGSSGASEARLLCAEDEQGRACWTTGMRLVKYGSQLRENFKAAVRYENKLGSPSAGSSVHHYSKLYVKSRVAMDFTGTGGKVVDDPNEALGVAIEEGYHWRMKAPRPSTPVAGSPKSESPRPRLPACAARLHLSQPWYHGGLPRDDAVSAIAAAGMVDGVFLVRESSSVPGMYVLSLAHHHKVKHCQIKSLQVEGDSFFSLDGLLKFPDLIALIEFYQLNASGLPTKLTHFVSRAH